MATQKEVAAHLFISDRQVRNLSKSPGAPKPKGKQGYSVDDWRRFYIDYLKSGGVQLEVSSEDDDSAEMRALKIKIQQTNLDDKLESIKMRKVNRKIKEAQWGPLEIITAVTSQLAVAINSRIEGMLPRLKQIWPDMPVEAYEALNKEVIAISNELADVDPDFSEYLEIDSEEV